MCSSDLPLRRAGTLDAALYPLDTGVMEGDGWSFRLYAEACDAPNAARLTLPVEHSEPVERETALLDVDGAAVRCDMIGFEGGELALILEAGSDIDGRLEAEDGETVLSLDPLSEPTRAGWVCLEGLDNDDVLTLSVGGGPERSFRMREIEAAALEQAEGREG